MRLNPEFLRNLWLEFSLPRLVATPVVLGLFIVLVQNSAGTDGVLTTAAVLFLGVTAAWGSGLASDALLREIQGGTWALQRLTAIHPWPMTWGKLLGATAYAWYVGIWCLLAMVVAAGSLDEPAWGLIHNDLPVTILFFVGLALFFHAASLLSALLQASQRKAAVRRRSLLIVLGMILLGSMLLNMIMRLKGEVMMVWWDNHWPADYFWLISLYVGVGWLLLGATMLMRKELQVPNQPWVWIGFVVFINGYLAGFVSGTTFISGSWVNETTQRLGLVTLTTMALTYLMVFVEGTTVVDLSRLLQRLRAANFLNAFREVPRWALTTIAAWLVGVVLLIQDAVSDTPTWAGHGGTSSEADLNSMVIAGLLFLLRDIAIVLFARFSSKKDRAALAAVAYLAILYYLIPWLLTVASMGGIHFLFLPTGHSPWLAGVVPPLLQAGLAWFLVVKRWRRDAAALPVALSQAQ